MHGLSRFSSVVTFFACADADYCIKITDMYILHTSVHEKD